VSPEVIASSKPEPEPEANSDDDSDQSCDEISQPPAVDAPDVTDVSLPEPNEEAEVDRSNRTLLWVTADIVRSRRTGRPLIELKVCPSPSTNTNGDRPVRFSIEESASSAVHRYKLLDGPTNLGRGFRLVSPAAALRLAIELWR
jgi:hypothetical protein